MAHVFSKCQLCTHAHIQHSRHEVWDDKSEQKRKVFGVCPSITIHKKSLRDSRISVVVVVGEYWSYKESIQKLNICVFSSKN